MSNVKANRTHSEHCDFKSELIRLLGPGSCAAALFPNVVRLRVKCGHLSHRTGPGPDPRRAVPVGRGPLWLKLSHKRASSFAPMLSEIAKMIISRPDVY